MGGPSPSTGSRGKQRTAREEAGEWRELAAARKDRTCCKLGVSGLLSEATVRLTGPGGGRRLMRRRAGMVWSGLCLGGHGDWAWEGEHGLVSLEAAPWHRLPR